MFRSCTILAVLSLSLLSSFVTAESVPYLVQSIEASKAKGFITLKGPGKIIIDGKNQPYGLGDTVYISTQSINSLANIDSENGEYESAKRYSASSTSTKMCSIRFQTSHYAETIAVQKMDCEKVLEVIHEAND